MSCVIQKISDDALQTIFEWVSIDDLLYDISLINKKWYFLIFKFNNGRALRSKMQFDLKIEQNRVVQCTNPELFIKNYREICSIAIFVFNIKIEEEKPLFSKKHVAVQKFFKSSTRVIKDDCNLATKIRDWMALFFHTNSHLDHLNSESSNITRSFVCYKWKRLFLETIQGCCDKFFECFCHNNHDISNLNTSNEYDTSTRRNPLNVFGDNRQCFCEYDDRKFHRNIY